MKLECGHGSTLANCSCQVRKEPRKTRRRIAAHDKMQQSLSQWKRQRKEDRAGDALPVLREGIRITVADCRPDYARAIMKDLTFMPFQGYDKGEPPQPVRCYVAAEDGSTLLLPRCYRGVPGPPEDRLCDGAPLSCAFTGTLNPLQSTAAEATLAQVRAPPFAAMLVLPCGFGKTVVGLSLAAALGRKTLVVVHKDFLLNQWRERIATFLPTARLGVIQQNRLEFEDVDVAIAMLQTLCARELPPECLASFGTVVLDEAHHLAAPYFSQLFFKLPSRHVIGLTATPRRKDGLTEILHLFMGAFSYQLTARAADDLAVQRVLWPPRYACRPEPSQADTQRLKTRVARDAARSDFVAKICAEAVDRGRQVLCLSDRIEHLHDLRDRFALLRPGVQAALYIGGRGRGNLEERRIAEAEARVLFGSYAMSSEGLDVPRLDTLVMATPIGDATQAIGRILRPCDAKQPPLVVDVVDDCRAFARLDAARRGYYERSAFGVEDCDWPTFALGKAT